MDAVLMDLGMPKMPAVELVKTLRAAAPRIPIVAMMGYVDPEVLDPPAVPVAAP